MTKAGIGLCRDHGGKYHAGCRGCGVVNSRKKRRQAQLRARGYHYMLVDVLPTQRRLTALVALGWPLGWIAADTRVTKQTLGKIAHGRQARVNRATEASIRAMFDRLSMTRPQPITPRDKASVTEALSQAERFGWEPPLAWDEGEMDRPLDLKETIACQS